ncbi:NAD(P)H-dependent oxidoreductase [Orbaceae bacterium ac157xtp]
MDQLTEAFKFRHACKVFDKNKKLSKEDLDYILQAGRLSPSSFGLEPWHFLVISDEKLKAELKPICFDQQQITSCSHVVIVLYRKAAQFTMQSPYLHDTVKQQLSPNSDQATIDAACQYFINYCHNELPKQLTVDNWSEMQCYLPVANMLTAAAYKQIDSCAIGGFQYDKLANFLTENWTQFDKESYGIALCLAFGYRLEPVTSPKVRHDMDKIVTFL